MTDPGEIIPGITHEGLVALLDRHGLGELKTAEQLTGSDASPMLLVNGEVVLRFNRLDHDHPKLAWEALVYRRLRDGTDIPCPDVLALDTRRDVVPFDTLLLSYVEGTAGNLVWPGLDTAAREQVSEELGRMCGVIHRLHWPVYGEYLGVGLGFRQSVRWTDIVNGKIVKAYQQAQQLELMSQQLLDGVLTALNDGEAIFDSASRPTLAHTNLGWWNVLLRSEGDRWHIAALLDWESSIVADSTWEFAALWRDPDDLFPFPDSFMHGYRERHVIPDDFRIRQRLYRILYFLERAVTCAERAGKNAERTQFYLAWLRRLLVPR